MCARVQFVGGRPEFGGWNPNEAPKFVWQQGDIWQCDLPLWPGYYQFKVWLYTHTHTHTHTHKHASPDTLFPACMPACSLFPVPCNIPSLCVCMCVCVCFQAMLLDLETGESEWEAGPMRTLSIPDRAGGGVMVMDCGW